MKTVNLYDLDLREFWSEDDPQIRARAHFPFFAGNGTESSTLAYFELEPDCRMGAHIDSAEELLFLLTGAVEITVGGEDRLLCPGDTVLIPAARWHSVRNVGEMTARCLAFFSRATVETTFREPMMPFGHEIVGTPRLRPAVAVAESPSESIALDAMDLPRD